MRQSDGLKSLLANTLTQGQSIPFQGQALQLLAIQRVRGMRAGLRQMRGAQL
jgi:hypothetical protein